MIGFAVLFHSYLKLTIQYKAFFISFIIHCIKGQDAGFALGAEHPHVINGCFPFADDSPYHEITPDCRISEVGTVVSLDACIDGAAAFGALAYPAVYQYCAVFGQCEAAAVFFPMASESVQNLSSTVLHQIQSFLVSDGSL